MSSIVLSRMGSFHVGGRRVEVEGQPHRTISVSSGLVGVDHDPNGGFWIEQAYVQYAVPASLRLNTPVLLVHGGGMTGACWESTPDGRPGWLPRLLEAGLAVSVIDNVERGRAGFCAIPGEWTDAPVLRSDREAWTLFRFGAPGDFGTRSPYPGQQFPVDAFDALLRQMVPRWVTNTEAQLRALEAAIRRIGPCILMGHSHGGGLAAQAANTVGGDLVRALVLLEPHGAPPAFDPQAVRGRPCLTVDGDYIADDAFWRDLTARTATTRRGWAAAGGIVEQCDLVAHGLRGNSHMMMMDRNSDAVLHLIVAWIDRCKAQGLLS